jgi:hypothetical protein
MARPGWIAFEHADFRSFFDSRSFGRVALEMQITAVSWQVYEIR